jgi:hypothetical protein
MLCQVGQDYIHVAGGLSELETTMDAHIPTVTYRSTLQFPGSLLDRIDKGIYKECQNSRLSSQYCLVHPYFD